jgi:hypothetical protein
MDEKESLAALADLEGLIRENKDLNELEYRLSRFNLFEALSAVREEVRHSAYLAFLLNPAERHGVEDQFIREFLKRLATRAPTFPLTLIDCDTFDFSKAVVQREYKNIDILLTHEEHRFVMAIENKVESAEHDDQLQRYKKTVQADFPQFKQAFVFLTPDLTTPSDEDYWIPIDYGVVADSLQAVLGRRGCAMEADAKILAEHYLEMLGRHIMQESEIAQLAQRIYRAHKSAIDLIFENIPDQRSQLSDALAEHIGQDARLQVGRQIKTYVSFLIRDTLKIPGMSDAEQNYYAGETRSLLYGEFVLDRALKFRLVIGPGPEARRRRLLEHAQQNPTLFPEAKGSLGKKYKTILSKKVLQKTEMDGQVDECCSQISEWWTAFSRDTVPAIITFMAKANLDEDTGKK